MISIIQLFIQMQVLDFMFRHPVQSISSVIRDARTDPSVRVVVLIVVADRATLGKARDRRVRPADHDLVVGIEEVGRVPSNHAWSV